MDAFTKSLCENSELYFKHYKFYSELQLLTFLGDFSYFKNRLDLNAITYNKWENVMKSPILLFIYNGGLGWMYHYCHIKAMQER
jgi:hypothetical protein